MPKSETTERRQWVVRDESGKLDCSIYAVSREQAIDIFCHPALRKEAYFGPGGGWTCEEHQHDL